MSTDTERTGNNDRLSAVETMKIADARRRLESLGEKEVWDEFDFKTIDTLLQRFPALAGEKIMFYDDRVHGLIEYAPLFMVVQRLPQQGKEHLDLLRRVYEVTPAHITDSSYRPDVCVFTACWGDAEAMIWLLIEKFPDAIKSDVVGDDVPLQAYIENYDEPCPDLVQVFVDADPTASLHVPSRSSASVSVLLRGLTKRLDPSILKLLLPRDPTNVTLDLSGKNDLVEWDRRGGPVEAALLAGNLPNWISTIVIDTRFCSSEGLCVLFVLLANNMSLHQFEIRFYESCDTDTLRNLSFFLQESPHLRVLKLTCNIPNTEDNVAGDDIDSIIDAAAAGLCNNTCIVELKLEFSCSPSNMRGVRSLLFGCQHLAKLGVKMHESTRLLNESATSLVNAVEHCPTLTRFSLTGPISGADRFIDMVAKHKSIKAFLILHDRSSDLLGVSKLVNLKEFWVLVLSSESDERLALAILELLTSSKVLRTLSVYSVPLPPVALCKILKNNTRLEKIDIECDRGNSSEAMVEVLEHNCTLKWVFVRAQDGEWPNRPELSYYCRLNASGRGKLRLPCAAKAEVVELLGHIAPPVKHPCKTLEAVPNHEEDSVRYGLLREAPHLWCQIEERLRSPKSSGKPSEDMAKSDQQVPKRRRLHTF